MFELGRRITTAPTLDVSRFSKVRALYDSTDHLGEWEAAAGRMKALAQAAGLTVAQAKALIDAPEPTVEQALDDFLNDLYEEYIAFD